MNACRACRQGKRRCNRARPQCLTCSRVGRPCIYDKDTASTTPNIESPDSIRQNVESSSPSPSSVSFKRLPGPLTDFDPFQNDTLRRPLIDVAVATEAAKLLGSFDRVRETTTSYFNTIHKRLPIISPQRFTGRLSSFDASPPASFATLYLCMHLVQQAPLTDTDSMLSNLYLTAKSMVGLMEGAGYNDLDAIQCRVMIAFYELGHGICPAASISIAGCARLAHAVGLHKNIEHEAQVEEKAEMEERRRVWWAIVNLDRYINLCTGNSFFSTPDLASSFPIPIDDDLWLHNKISPDPPHRLSTPSSADVGIFARECQITHLTGMVVRHVCEPTLDVDFQLEEALQLERTLMAFMPLLLEENITFGKFCVALAICTSALFTLNDALVRRGQRGETEAGQKIEELSASIFGFTDRLFGDVDRIDYTQLSPYVVYCVYQSAVVQTRLWKARNDEVHMEKASWLRRLLGLLDRKWRTAGKYLKALDREDLLLVLYMPPSL